MMRLNKYLASCGVASRRASETLVQEGRVKINGNVVSELGIQVGEQDKVTVDGKSVKPVTKKVYIMMHKPKGFVTTASDERGRKTVFELFNIRERVFPIGRLDIKSEGLLLFTNDGELAHRLMHPGFKVNKTYRVKLDRDFDPKGLDALRSGIELDDGMTSPCRASFYTNTFDRVEVRMKEGRKNQVRRMFLALGYDVVTLKRVQYGPLTLENLDRGKWRFLNSNEVRQLKMAAGLMRRNKTGKTR